MGRQNHKKKDKIYRLSIAEDATHHIIIGFRFTKFMAIVACVTVSVATIFIIYCGIAFTPLRRTIPGYPDAYSKKEAIANAIKIDSLESCITRWELYAENLSRILSGEPSISFDSIIRSTGVKYVSDKTSEELHRQDSIMRQMASGPSSKRSAGKK